MSNCCPNCFNDPEIKSFISTYSKEKGFCDYCHSQSDLLDINELSAFFSSLFNLYEKSDSSGAKSLSWQMQKDWQLFSQTVDVEKIITDLIPLVKIPYSSESKYVHLKEIESDLLYWNQLKVVLKNRKRFCYDANELIDRGWDQFFIDLIYSIKSGEELYRSRLCLSNHAGLYHKREMGTPPSALTMDGRANPKGIPYLYVSKDIETTLYEIRATYLDLVCVGTFVVKPDTELKIVDLTASLNPFVHEDDLVSFSKMKFLISEISEDLSRPLLRYDSRLEYVGTQFFCEFIRYYLGADGVQYESSLHQRGINIVIFNQDKLDCIDVQERRIAGINLESEIVSSVPV